MNPEAADSIAPSRAVLQEMRGIIAGEVLAPGDPGYEQARRVRNGSIDKRPGLIVCCAGVADVVRSIALARDHELPLAVRGGGHNVAGFGTCDDGVVIDLSLMNNVQVDPERRTARAGGGATWGDFDSATHAFGLATTGGQVSTTGIGGLTLGGGIGWLLRKHGLSCDNLLSAELVTADGTPLTASANEHPDLFWGIRGGGGNFGVATSLTYRLHPVDVVLGGLVLHPASRAIDVMRFFRDYAAEAPDELSLIAGFWVPVPEPGLPASLVGVPVVAIGACYAGRLEDGEEILRPLRKFGAPVWDGIAPMPYPALQTLLDPASPTGVENYAKAEYLSELGDDAIEALVASATDMSSPLSQVYVSALGGAFARVGDGASAFSHREAPWVVNILAMWSGSSDRDVHIEWARSLWTALRPFSAGGVYVNFLGDEGSEGVRAAYREPTYARLVEVKTRYDPTNLFRLNQNIKPRPKS